MVTVAARCVLDAERNSDTPPQNVRVGISKVGIGKSQGGREEWRTRGFDGVANGVLVSDGSEFLRGGEVLVSE